MKIAGRILFRHGFAPLLVFFVCATSWIPRVPSQSSDLGQGHCDDPLFLDLRRLSPATTGVSTRGVKLRRDVATLAFEEGTFYFLTPIRGRVVGAVFIGQGVFRLTPPVETERRFLRHLTQAEELIEPFTQAILYFTDKTYEELKAQVEMRDEPPPRSVSDVFKEHQQVVRRELKQSVELRLLADLYTPSRPGFFTAFLKGKNLPRLVFGVDPLGFAPSLPSPEEVGVASYDETTKGIWSLFHRQEEYAAATASMDEDHREYDIAHYTIDATIGRNERLTARADVTLVPRQAGLRVIRMMLFPTLRVNGVRDGHGAALPYIQTDEEEGGAFAIVLPEAARRDEPLRFAISYSGRRAIHQSGTGTYLLLPEARSTWYPNNWQVEFGDRATFDLTIRAPRGETVVATGTLVRRERAGEYDVSVWKSEYPVVVAGFNYGTFKVREQDDDGFRIEVYTNTSEPDEVKQIRLLAERLEQQGVRLPVTLGTLTTTGLAERSLIEAINSIRIFSAYFGTNPYGRVALSQQPAAFFGQSWPMLIYLPYTAFLDGTQRRSLGLPVRFSEFTDVVGPHEIAHQWWGHLIVWKTYRDQWLSEGFSDFSASLYLQLAYDRDPATRLSRYLKFWQSQREVITEKALLGVMRASLSPNGVGPLSLGVRLNTGRTSGAYERLAYAKGAFVLHMLRMMMNNPRASGGLGDDRFIAMMRDFVRRYTHKAASTEDFQRVVEAHMTPDMDLDGNRRMDWFFNQWVHGTDLPHYTLEYKTERREGKILLTVRITQSNVSDRFKMLVPLYADFGKGRIMRLGVARLTGNSSTETELVLPQLPERVLLNAMEDVLSTQRIIRRD